MFKSWIEWIPMVFAVMGFACSHPNESDLPLHASGLSTPVVTGLRITLSSGPMVVAVWGNPCDPVDGNPGYHYGGGERDTIVPETGGIPYSYSFAVPYPNPSDGSTVLGFALPRSSRVNLWIVRARWWQSPNTDVVPVLGSAVLSPNNRAVSTLMRDEEKGAGTYRFTWDTRDDGGQLVPSGFYRVFFQAGNYSSWHDVFLYRSLDDLPGDLRSMIHH